MSLSSTESSKGLVVSWADPMDDSIKAFKVYKSASSGFDPSTMDPIAEVGEPSFTDADVTIGNRLYYVVAAVDFSGNQSEFSEELPVVIVSVEDNASDGVPEDFALHQNYPNPFNPTTMIRFDLPQSERVRITIYNINGALIRTLAEGAFGAGNHNIVWDARNDTGHIVSGGTYLYRLEAETYSMTKKMLLLK